MVITKKIIVGSSAVGVTVVSILAYLLTIPGIIITTSGDIKCDGTIANPCVSYFNITSTNFTLKFFNVSKQKMNFAPDIKDYTIYKLTSTGKWTSTKFPINMTKGTLYQFKVIGYKNTPTQRVKWGVEFGDAIADPWWDVNYANKRLYSVFNPSATDSWFPILVNVTVLTNFQADLKDFRSVDSIETNGLKYNYEAKVGTSYALFTVKPNSTGVRAGKNESIYIYYNYASAVNSSTPKDVWNVTAHYTFDTNGKDDTFVNNLTTTGTPVFLNDRSCQFGNCYYTDNSANYFTGSITAITPVTVCIWLNRTGHVGDNMLVNWGAAGGDVLMADSYNDHGFDCSAGPWGRWIGGEMAFLKWYHVCCVYTATTASIYVNGTLKGGPDSYSLGLGSNTINVGRGIAPYTQTYWGEWDEFTIFNTTLSANQVMAFYQSYNMSNYVLGVEESPVVAPTWVIMNGVAPNGTFTYPITPFCTGSSMCTMWRNNTNVTSTNNTAISLGAGDYNFTASITGNQTTAILRINPSKTSSILLLNGTDSDKNVIFYNQYIKNQVANFTVSLNVSGKTVGLASNYTGFVTVTGTTPLANYTNLTALNTWNITGYFDGDANYTGSSATHYFIVAGRSECPVPSPIILNETNSTYNMNNSIDTLVATYCINIAAENVTVDCHGYHMTNLATSDYGIYSVCPSGICYNNTIIRNCNITNWANDIVMTKVAYPYLFNNIGQTTSDLTIAFSTTWYATVKDFTSIDSVNGIDVGTYYSTYENITSLGTGTNGLVIFGSVRNNTIKNCTVKGKDSGIEFSGTKGYNNTISNCSFSNNTIGIDFFGEGALVSNNNTATNSTFYNNTYGIRLLEQSIIFNNIFYNNTASFLAAGFLTTNNRIYNNLFNDTIYLNNSGYWGINYWNSTKQIGTRIYDVTENGTSAWVGGNYWTNSTKNGYSDTCVDYGGDYICDIPFNLTVGSTLQYDYAPLGRLYQEPKASTVNLWLNNTAGDYLTIYGSQVNATAVSNTTGLPLTLKVNNTEYGTGYGKFIFYLNRSELANATYNITADWAGNLSHYGSSASYYLRINKDSATLYLALNGTEGNITMGHGSVSNATGWKTAWLGNFTLWRNNSIVSSTLTGNTASQIVALGIGTWNYTVDLINQNYSAPSVTRWLIVKNISISVMMPETKIISFNATTADSNVDNDWWSMSTSAHNAADPFIVITGGFKFYTGEYDYANPRNIWQKFNSSNLPYFDYADLNLYQNPLTTAYYSVYGCNTTNPCQTQLFYSSNQSWGWNLTWDSQPEYDNYIIDQRNFTTNTNGWRNWNVTNHLKSVLKNTTFMLRIPMLNISKKGMNFTSGLPNTDLAYYPYISARVTKYLINESSCSYSPTCYQNGTFTPKGQTSTQWMFNVSNIAGNIFNMSAYWSPVLPSCMNHYLSTNSTFERLVDFNVTNSTSIKIINNFAIGTNQTFWGFFELRNCTVGTTLNSTLIFTSSWGT